MKWFHRPKVGLNPGVVDFHGKQLILSNAPVGFLVVTYWFEQATMCVVG